VSLVVQSVQMRMVATSHGGCTADASPAGVDDSWHRKLSHYVHCVAPHMLDSPFGFKQSRCPE
jgi:hypothetical protein